MRSTPSVLSFLCLLSLLYQTGYSNRLSDRPPTHPLCILQLQLLTHERAEAVNLDVQLTRGLTKTLNWSVVKTVVMGSVSLTYVFTIHTVTV